MLWLSGITCFYPFIFTGGFSFSVPTMCYGSGWLSPEWFILSPQHWDSIVQALTQNVSHICLGINMGGVSWEWVESVLNCLQAYIVQSKMSGSLESQVSEGTQRTAADMQRGVLVWAANITSFSSNPVLWSSNREKHLKMWFYFPFHHQKLSYSYNYKTNISANPWCRNYIYVRSF